jgi:protein TonB
VYQFIQQHKEYPALARRADLDGRVILDVVITRDGQILNVEVHESSGHKLLDESAVETLRDLGQLPSPPTELKWDKKRLRIPMAYQLN